jgi:hypothetical protein
MNSDISQFPAARKRPTKASFQKSHAGSWYQRLTMSKSKEV